MAPEYSLCAKTRLSFFTSKPMHANSASMPLFSKSLAKYMARELHIGVLYPLITGRLCIPEGKGYWYLCNEQDGSEGSEHHQINILSRMRDGNQYVFAKPGQCYGVDRSRNIIRRNRRLLPESNWIAAEWIEAIQDQRLFDPALVYLDTTSFADRMPAVNALNETLMRCKKGTLVICNVMMNNARAGMGEDLFDECALIENLLMNQHRETFAAWNVSPEDPAQNVFHSYEYRTRKALMRSYILFKGTLPAAERIVAEFDRFKEWCSLTTHTHGIE